MDDPFEWWLQRGKKQCPTFVQNGSGLSVNPEYKLEQ